MTVEKKKKPVKAAGKTAKISGKTGKTPVKTPVKAPVKKTVKKPAKTPAKTPVKTPKKPPVKTSAKAAVKTPSKVSAKTPVKTVKRPVKSRNSGPKIDWQAFTEKMEQFLMEQKSGIIENLIASNKDFKEIVEGMDPKDFADIASDDIDRKMIEALGSQELKRMKLIDSALTRIKQGKYGFCMKCDKRIPPNRLEAIPYALMCIDCKSEEERRNR